MALILGLLNTGLMAAQEGEDRYFTIMDCCGTQTVGNCGPSYLYPLWEKLFGAGYKVDFIGPQQVKCRIGTLGYYALPTKDETFWAEINDIYGRYTADIVLLHVEQMMSVIGYSAERAVGFFRSVIDKLQSIHPNVFILIFQSEQKEDEGLNEKLAELVFELRSEHILWISSCQGSHEKKVSGGDEERIVQIWSVPLQNLLRPYRQVEYHPEKVGYKILADGDTLKLHVFRSEMSFNQNEKMPAIVYFFGGGWVHGTPLQFYRECDYYAKRGFVAISVDYRIKSVNNSTPFDSFEDAKDAIRWIRCHSRELHIDPAKIAVAGASAGGQLAAALGTIGADEVKAAEYRPNLMLLYYPVVDNGPAGYGPSEMKRRYREISPLHNINTHTFPVLFLLGTEDALIPVSTAKEFKRKMEENGGECELHLLEGAGHPIFSYRKPATPLYFEIQALTDQFLRRLK